MLTICFDRCRIGLGVVMFKNDVFKEKINGLQSGMKNSLRGEIASKIENSVIDELGGIYLTMVDRYTHDVKAGSQFQAQPDVMKYPENERVYQALLDLLERMELDFTRKLVMDFKHDLSKEIEIGKIKISFLDGVRRGLHSAWVK